MPIKEKKILAIEDTSSIRTFLRISLQSQGADFYEAASANEGLDTCAKVNPDVIVLDLGLPDRDGLEILPELIKICDPIIIVLSVRKEQPTIDAAYALGAKGYISKPFMMENLIEVMEKLVTKPL